MLFGVSFGVCVCVCSRWCVWSIGTCCVHCCIDAIRLSSAYLTAQTFFSLLLPAHFLHLSPSVCFLPMQPFTAIYFLLFPTHISLSSFSFIGCPRSLSLSSLLSHSLAISLSLWVNTVCVGDSAVSVSR